MNKFGAKRAVDRRGRWYDSKLERDYAEELSLLEQAGAIVNLEAQPRVELERGIFYKPDFAWTEPNGRRVFCDTKGIVTERFRLICKLWALHGPGVLQIVQRRSKREGFRVTREILPKGEA